MNFPGLSVNSLHAPLHAVTHPAPYKYLSEEEHESPGRQGGVSPRTTRERSRNAGAQRAREPVTKATAVKPREDRTKLGLQILRGSQTPQLCPPLSPWLSLLSAIGYDLFIDFRQMPQASNSARISGPKYKASWQDTTLGLIRTPAPAEASEVEERGKLTFVPVPSDLPTKRWGSGVVNLSGVPQLLSGALVPPGTAAGRPARLDLVSPGKSASFGTRVGVY